MLISRRAQSSSCAIEGWQVTVGLAIAGQIPALALTPGLGQEPEAVAVGAHAGLRTATLAAGQTLPSTGLMSGHRH